VASGALQPFAAARSSNTVVYLLALIRPATAADREREEMVRPSKEPCKKEACDIQACLSKNLFDSKKHFGREQATP